MTLDDCLVEAEFTAEDFQGEEASFERKLVERQFVAYATAATEGTLGCHTFRPSGLDSEASPQFEPTWISTGISME